MNGFRQDLISILKHNSLLQRMSIGIILGDMENQRHWGLYKDLSDRKQLIELSSKLLKFTKYDYVVITKEFLSVKNLLKAMVELNRGGIIILEITGKAESYQEKYLSMVGGMMSGTKVLYEDRGYVVLHTGEDYGN